jgi:hypothetical protein
MGLMTALGKLLIIASIAFQAYLIFADRQAISTFDKNLSKALTACNCLTPEIQALTKQFLPLVVVALLGSSILMLLSRAWLLKLPTLLGLGLLLWVEHHQVFRTIPTLALLENTGFWHSLGLLGVIIYLLGAECTACKSEKSSTVASAKTEGSKDKVETKEESKSGKGRKR